MTFRNICILLLAALLLVGSKLYAQNKFGDVLLQKIYEHQDRRQSTELLHFLRHPQALYRQQAALAFASVQDSSMVGLLLDLLADQDEGVRHAAAYSLGQTAHLSAQKGLIQAFPKESSARVKNAIAEAIGKCADKQGVDFLAALPADAATVQGQVTGLYRAVLKRIFTPKGDAIAVGALQSTYPDAVRLMAAAYLARHPQKNYSQYLDQLLLALASDKQPHVRMNLASALANSQEKRVTEALAKQLKDASYLVRINSIRALNRFDTAVSQPLVIPLLKDKNLNVQVTAADFVLAHARPGDGVNYLALAKACPNYRARATVLAAAMRLEKDPAGPAAAYIKKAYGETKSVYEKGALIKALAENVAQLEFVKQEFSQKFAPPLNTFVFEAVLQLIHLLPQDQTAQADQLLLDALNTRDGALLALAAGELRDPAKNYRTRFADKLDLIRRIKDQLPLPLEMESYIELQRTLDFLEGKTPAVSIIPEFNHPIDWKHVAGIAKNAQVSIKTTKGTIVLELLTEEAPASVSNFVKLLEEGFYNGKSFHRVVPNFVIQTGCPRGDGYGNVPYSIRSEWGPLNYLEGYVGMASAGKDTEGTQWFISHSPTPHLDGRYTIFARVVKGMEVVHQIGVGDKIVEARLIKK